MEEVMLVFLSVFTAVSFTAFVYLVYLHLTDLELYDNSKRYLYQRRLIHRTRGVIGDYKNKGSARRKKSVISHIDSVVSRREPTSTVLDDYSSQYRVVDSKTGEVVYTTID